MHNSVKKLVLYFVLLSLFISANVATAKVKAVTGQLTIVAMLDGKPAFRTVLWELSPKSNRNKTINIRKHAATIDLEPGVYTIIVSMGNQTRTRHITIKESSKQQLIVSMDEKNL